MDEATMDAVVAAREAEKRLEDVPNAVRAGTRIGECPDCEARFDYGVGTDGPVGLEPCPECGARRWYKWGYRFHGEELRKDEAWDQFDAPGPVEDRYVHTDTEQ